MGTNNKKTSGGGVGFLGLLTLLFIALKLLGKNQLELVAGFSSTLDSYSGTCYCFDNYRIFTKMRGV